MYEPKYFNLVTKETLLSLKKIVRSEIGKFNKKRFKLSDRIIWEGELPSNSEWPREDFDQLETMDDLVNYVTDNSIFNLKMKEITNDRENFTN